MYPDDLRACLAPALDPAPSPVPAPGDRLAAVLLPIVEGPEPSIVLTRRTEHLPRHAGEISFPGGLVHDDDASLADTALRETEEELGVHRTAIEVIGALAPVHTFVSGILIVPFVGVLAERPAFAPDAGEIAEVLEYPLARLVRADSEVELPRGDHVYRGFAYEMDGATIWGATGRILHELIDVLRKGAVMSSASSYAPGDAELRSILGDARTVAVVGLSPKPHRDSYQVAEYLQRKGYRIVPVNPNTTEVLGERAYPSLLDVPEDVEIDVVNVFRRAEDTPAVAEEAVGRGAKVLWLQSGIVNDDARRIGEEAGLTVIMGVCIRTTSRRLDERA